MSTSPLQSIDQNVSDVQPLHQDKKVSISNLEYQRQLLAKKLVESEGKFASPTDSMMSPCTAKLQANKKRHYNKAKPMSLSSRFTQVAMQNGAGDNKENKQVVQ